MQNASQKSLLLFAISIYCLTILPRLLSYGMWLDGVTYASIARNMAENYGSFWKPYYTATLYSEFHENPPLGLWLQSLAYRLLGDSVYIEAFWGFFVGAGIILFIALIWRQNLQPESSLLGSWLPILLFVIIPTTSWLLSGNMLEATMTVFTMLSSYTCILGIGTTLKSKYIMYALLAGVMIFLATLTKGPVGLFPFAIPVIAMSTIQKPKLQQTISITFFMIVAFFALYAVIFLVSSESIEFFSRYFHQQLAAAVSGKREKAPSHFSLLEGLFNELIVPVILAAIIGLVVHFKKKTRIKLTGSRPFWFYLLIAFSGSLPILISAKQGKHYAFPAFPFYALAIASYFHNLVLPFEQSITEKPKANRGVWIFSSTIIFVSLVWMLTEKGVLRKVKDFHNDFTVQPIQIAPRQIISVYPQSLRTDWTVIANMQRQFKASLSDSIGYKYLLTSVDSVNSPLIKLAYHKIHPPHSKKYVLLEKKSLSVNQ
jgi:4-amino-4-deoxy-L-arabinose transferase-like glycosyltransferase